MMLFLMLAGALLLAEPEYEVLLTAAGSEALLAGDEVDEEVWQAAQRVAWGPSRYRTDFRALWNRHGLYVRFDVTDDDPWHTKVHRDDPLWEEEVVEIFIDPNRTGTDYMEVEWNPAGVVCDLHVISGKPNVKADIHWDVEGLESKTRWIRNDEGTITGWTVTALLPWTALRSLPSTSDVSLPPQRGDRWRFNVFRIERPGGKDDPERDVVLAAWSPPPGRSFHVPEVFRELVFTGK